MSDIDDSNYSANESGDQSRGKNDAASEKGSAIDSAAGIQVNENEAEEVMGAEAAAEEEESEGEEESEEEESEGEDLDEDDNMVTEEQPPLKFKQWVRLKSGIYKDDLAQVDYVNLAQTFVHLKLIPRVDYTKKRGALQSTEESEKDEKPIAKLFDVDTIRSLGGEVFNDGDYFIFEGNRYSRKGFLFKSFKKSACVINGVKPTLSELEMFAEKNYTMGMEVECNLSC